MDNPIDPTLTLDEWAIILESLAYFSHFETARLNWEEADGDQFQSVYQADRLAYKIAKHTDPDFDISAL